MEENIRRKNWFGRNWKWAVPVSGCLLFIVLIIAFVGTVFVGVTSIFSESEPYQEAFTRIAQNERAVEILGEPIEADGMIRGNINYTNGDGTADFEIPVKDPNGAGIIHVLGSTTNDDWEYETLRFEAAGTGETVDLLEETPALEQ